MKPKEISLFLVAGLALCLCLFGAGLWGGQLLAPVDLAPALMAHYRYVDPGSNGIPANHHIIDQLSQDLPFQWTSYLALRRGEIPWWDPYTAGGRPFLADAHLNGSDPLRVLAYLTLPSFVLAYNWTRILHSLLGGLGLFCLLRRLSFAPLLAGALALTGEAAGCNALYFGHPWVQGAFVYYPWLWLVWDAALASRRRWTVVASTLLAAAVFCAGNLQSHAYLPIFAGLFCLSEIPWSWAGTWTRMRVLAPGLMLGGMLAAPFLLPELELFRLNQRPITASHEPNPWYAGLTVLASVYPWVGGTFRTLNYHTCLTFHLFIGSAGAVLAGFGAFANLDARPGWRSARRLSVALVITYVVVISTRLDAFLYSRIAGLGVLGVIVLAGIGLARLMEAPERFRRVLPFLAAAVILIPIGSYAVGWWIYPRWLEPKAARVMMEHGENDSYGGLAKGLRAFEVRQFPHEITFANVETLFAWLSLDALAAWLAFASRRPGMLPAVALLALNLAAPVLFLHRYLPHAELVWWERLRDGGPDQNAVAALLRPERRRLGENATAEFMALMPADFAHFYTVHTMTGYSTLKPLSFPFFPDVEYAKAWDYLYKTTALDGTGELVQRPGGGTARFLWLGEPARPIHITDEFLNRLEVEFPAGPAGALLRTDTFYPGWHAATADSQPLPLEKTESIFSRIAIPEGVTRVVFRYEPTGWRPGLVIALLAVGGTVWLARRPHPLAA